MAVSVYTGAGGGVASFNGRTGKVVPADGDYTKAQVGLSNVDNTSDANKPISTATQTALDKKQDKLPSTVTIAGSEIALINPQGYDATSFQVLDDGNSFVSVAYSADEDSYYGFSAPRGQNTASGQKPNEIHLVSVHDSSAGYVPNFTTPVSLKNVANPTDPTDAMNLRSTEEVAAKKVAVNGILKGDGTGAVTAAEETEVELVDLPTDHVSNISLPTASWTGSDPYTQTVTIPGSTANIKVDIQPSEEIYDQLVADNVGYLAIKNVNGTLTAVAKGGKPSVDLNIQVTYNDVSQ